MRKHRWVPGIILALLIMLAAVLSFESEGDEAAAELEAPSASTPSPRSPQRIEAASLSSPSTRSPIAEVVVEDADDGMKATVWRGIALLPDGSPAQSALVQLHPPIVYPEDGGMAYARDWGRLQTLCDAAGRAGAAGPALYCRPTRRLDSP